MTPDELSAKLRALGSGGLAKIIGAELATSGAKMEARAKLAVTGGNPLNTRTGRLRQSIGFFIETAPDLALHLESGGKRTGRGEVRYAAIHEYGGTIVPKTAKMLRIPIRGGPALTGAGVDRFPTPLRAAAPPGFFSLAKSASGALSLVHDGEPWYRLRRSVRIPARPYIRPSAEAELPELGRSMSRAIAAAFGVA